MELSVENLEAIHSMLASSHKDSIQALKNINFDNVNENMLLTHENRQILDSLFNQKSAYLLEIARVDSFLQYCNLNSLSLSKNQQEVIIACQKLCIDLKDSSNKVLSWVIETKAKINESGCKVADDIILESFSETKSPYFVDGKTISVSMFNNYQKYRDILREMHAEVLFTDPKEMMDTAGKRLGVKVNNSLHIETEHEMNVLIEFGFFQYRKDSKNIVERFYDKNHKLYSGHKLKVAEILKNGRFSFLEVIKPVEVNGLVVKDHLTNETFLMIDSGLHQLAKNHKNYAVLTHYLITPEFIMTTGASTPIPLNSDGGKKMWADFEKLINLKNANAVATSSYYQAIADIYKTAIHDDLLKTVKSTVLPLSYDSLHQTH